MKTPTLSPRKIALGLLASLALFATGCGNSAQKQAYERAAQREQNYTAETAPAIIAEYQQVIAIEPGSRWAEQARARIKAVETRVKAEEKHKDVFQEHGID